MLLIWLLIPAASVAMDCGTACEICQTDLNQGHGWSYSCSVCKKCRRSNNESKVQGISEQQKQELKMIEKREFAEMMKDYGWHPEDFIELNDNLGNDEECAPIPPADCLHASYEQDPNQEDDKKKLSKKITKCPTLPRIVYSPVAQVVCPSCCPPMAQNQPATEKTEKGNYTDLEDYPERLINTITRPTSTRTSPSARITSPLTSSSTTQKTTQTTIQTSSCTPCVPSCQLPCSPYSAVFPPPVPNPPPPISALQALLTLFTSSPTLNEKIYTEATKEKSAYMEKSVEIVNEESDDDEGHEKITTKTKKPHKKEKIATNDLVEYKDEKLEDDEHEIIIKTKTTKTMRPKKKEKTANMFDSVEKYEEWDDETEETNMIEETTKTTKDYVYMYVGIPKDAVNVRRG